MNFAIQLLDGSRAVISEWPNPDTARAIELTQDVRWPAGASQLKILDENGLAAHWRIEPNEQSASRRGRRRIFPKTYAKAVAIGRRTRRIEERLDDIGTEHVAIHQRLERAGTQVSKLK